LRKVPQALACDPTYTEEFRKNIQSGFCARTRTAREQLYDPRLDVEPA
jgi:hypothetical protein